MLCSGSCASWPFFGLRANWFGSGGLVGKLKGCGASTASWLAGSLDSEVLFSELGGDWSIIGWGSGGCLGGITGTGGGTRAAGGGTSGAIGTLGAVMGTDSRILAGAAYCCVEKAAF